jgi:photosystem II stability/assembly factor-like uncharacterized protein
MGKVRKAGDTRSTCLVGLRVALAIVAVAGLGRRTYAAGQTWTGLGPEGGRTQALVIDPGAPGTIYAGTSNGVFRTTNGGGRWTRVSTGLGDPDVRALAIAPTSPTLLYAGTAGGVFKSSDGGGTWSAENTGLASLTVSALAIDPFTPATLYVASTAGLFKTTNGEIRWWGTALFLRVLSLVIDPVTPTTLYASTQSSGVFKSIDGGVSWSPTLNDCAGCLTEALAIDPLVPSTLYAHEFLSLGFPASISRIIKSTNGGTTWSSIAISGLVSAIAIDPTTSQVLYAATDRGVLKSVNGGATWSATTNFRRSNALAIDASNPARIYTGTDQAGILASADGGTTWSPSKCRSHRSDHHRECCCSFGPAGSLCRRLGNRAVPERRWRRELGACKRGSLDVSSRLRASRGHCDRPVRSEHRLRWHETAERKAWKRVRRHLQDRGWRRHLGASAGQYWSDIRDRH